MEKKVYFTNVEELTVQPLSTEEKKWVNKLAKVLSECPTRLELVTCGDTPSVIDGAGAKSSEIGDGAAERDGILLASIHSSPIIHGVSG